MSAESRAGLREDVEGGRERMGAELRGTKNCPNSERGGGNSLDCFPKFDLLQ